MIVPPRICARSVTKSGRNNFDGVKNIVLLFSRATCRHEVLPRATDTPDVANLVLLLVDWKDHTAPEPGMTPEHRRIGRSSGDGWAFLRREWGV